MSHRAAWGLLFVLALICSSCEREPAPSQTARPVIVREIVASSPEVTRSFSGAAKADVEAALSFRVSGKIVELPASVGLQVREGDLIARLDPMDFRLKVREAEAALARARARFSRARADYERARLLYETENISRAELDEARSGFQSAQAQVSAARESLEMAQRQLGYTTLDSPIAGGIAEVPVDVYQSVNAGTPVAILVGSGSLRFEIGVPEALISKVRQGAPATVTFESHPNRFFSATVVEVGILSRQLTVFPVTLQFEETDSRILPGMVGAAELSFPREAQETLLPVVPLEAVLTDREGGRFVWTVDPQTRIPARQSVEVGDLSAGGILIRKGLSPGDLVVVRGGHRVRAEQEVSILWEDEYP